MKMIFNKMNPLIWMESAQRAALIALPFISLSRPCGQAISFGMGSLRALSQLTIGITAGSNYEFIDCAIALGKSALSVSCIAGSFFNFQFGLLLTISLDLCQHLLSSIQNLYAQNYIEALDDILQASSCALHLCIMATGSLEMILVSALMQALMSLYQSLDDYKQEQWPEMIAKIAMGMIRTSQALGYADLIQKRSSFQELEKLANLLDRLGQAREIDHLIDSPIHDLIEDRIETDAEDESYNFGAHFHGSGKGAIKGMNVEFRTQDGITELNFKINHVFRDQLQSLIEELDALPPKQLKELLAITNSHTTNIRIEKIPFELSKKHGIKFDSAAWKFHFDGLGSVTVGASKDIPTLYNRVKIEIKGKRNLYAFHEMLSFFNLNDALRHSSLEDIERLKIGHLFRVFCPTKATLFERTPDFFTLPIDQLKEKIVEKAPEMRAHFELYLNNMKTREILPGRKRYSIPGLADKIYELGGRALVASVSELDRIATILKTGMLSSETRFSHDMTTKGLSSHNDFYTGSADSVFTQFLTKNEFEQEMDLGDLYRGKVHILFSLDPLETGSYQYDGDKYGTRRIEFSDSANSDRPVANTYLNRPNIFDFTKTATSEFSDRNEVMIKERIPPEMIKALIVEDIDTKDALLAIFRRKGIVDMSSGIETIYGIPVDRFIYVSWNLLPEMIS